MLRWFFLPFFLITISFSNAHPDKEKLWLVVGSRRVARDRFEPPMDLVFGSGCADSEYLKTFDGQSTTMDTEPCASESLKNRHIQGDAASYDFCEKYTIKAAYLDRITTIDFNKTRDPFNYRNLLGEVVLNIARAMENNAKMVIEWDACVSRWNGPDAFITSANFEQRRRKNPFTGFIPSREFFEKINEACDRAKTVQDAFSFWTLSKIFCVSYERIVKALKWELSIMDWFKITDIDSRKSSMYILNRPFVNMDAFFDEGPLCFPISDDFTAAFLEKFTSQGNPCVHTQESFIQHSGLAVLLRWVSCEANTPLVIKFMEQHGFKDVSVFFGNSPYNGRKNVYLIEAYRDINKPLPPTVQAVKD